MPSWPYSQTVSHCGMAADVMSVTTLPAAPEPHYCWPTTITGGNFIPSDDIADIIIQIPGRCDPVRNPNYIPHIPIVGGPAQTLLDDVSQTRTTWQVFPDPNDCWNIIVATNDLQDRRDRRHWAGCWLPLPMTWWCVTQVGHVMAALRLQHFHGPDGYSYLKVCKYPIDWPQCPLPIPVIIVDDIIITGIRHYWPIPILVPVFIIATIPDVRLTLLMVVNIEDTPRPLMILFIDLLLWTSRCYGRRYLLQLLLPPRDGGRRTLLLGIIWYLLPTLPWLICARFDGIVLLLTERYADWRWHCCCERR